MSEKQYLKRIRRLLKCCKSKKDEIIKQIQSDIAIALEEGKDIDTVLSQMESPLELAKEFNESMSREELKAAGREKILKVSGIVIVAVLLLAAVVYWGFPKTSEISDSSIFNKDDIINMSKQVISCVDKDDMEGLKPLMTGKLKKVLTQKALTDAKSMISDDFGEFQTWGKTYIVALNQFGSDMAVTEVTVSYENVSVTYRLTFDDEMKLAGLYMR